MDFTVTEGHHYQKCHLSCVGGHGNENPAFTFPFRKQFLTLCQLYTEYIHSKDYSSHQLSTQTLMQSISICLFWSKGHLAWNFSTSQGTDTHTGKHYSQFSDASSLTCWREQKDLEGTHKHGRTCKLFTSG